MAFSCRIYSYSPFDFTYTSSSWMDSFEVKTKKTFSSVSFSCDAMHFTLMQSSWFRLNFHLWNCSFVTVATREALNILIRNVHQLNQVCSFAKPLMEEMIYLWFCEEEKKTWKHFRYGIVGLNIILLFHQDSLLVSYCRKFEEKKTVCCLQSIPFVVGIQIKSKET